MGLMDKLRDMFTEEVEEPVEEPIKKEVIQVEIPAPKKHEEPEEIEEESKKIEKPSPIFFDDTDFAGLEPPKPKPKETKKISSYYEKPKKEEKKEEPKKFKPTPIISPIYGVLDKNYHKEDIKTKNNSENTTYYNHKEVSIDDIRKKAYGTLEDDLEDTLNTMNKLSANTIKESINDINDAVDAINTKANKIENYISKVEEQTPDVSIGELEDKVKETIDVSNDTVSDSTLEHDLFNLIDSMYDKED